MGKPYLSCQKHIPEGSPQQFRLCIDYRKLNSLSPSVIQATGTKEGAFALIHLPKIDELSIYSKEQGTLQPVTSAVVTTTSNWTKNQYPKVLLQQFLASSNF